MVLELDYPSAKLRNFAHLVGLNRLI